MGFLMACPNCGDRDVAEFRFGGEVTARPAPDAPPAAWAAYLSLRRNEAGPQAEWWFHRHGCRRWFLAERDTRTNRVARTWWPPSPAGPPAGPAPGDRP